MRSVVLSIIVCVRRSMCVSVGTSLGEDMHSYERLLVFHLSTMSLSQITISKSLWCYSK